MNILGLFKSYGFVLTIKHVCALVYSVKSKQITVFYFSLILCIVKVVFESSRRSDTQNNCSAQV